MEVYLVVYLKVVLKNGLSLLLLVVDVVNHFTMFQKHDARTDIDGMLEVVTADENRGASLFVVLLQQMLDGILTAGVEEVEGLVKNEHLRTKQHGCHDANLLFVAGTERTDKLLLACQLVGHEVLKL